MTAADYKVQINVKVGDHLINVNGDTPDEALGRLAYLSENADILHTHLAKLDGRPATEIVQKETTWGARSKGGRSYPKPSSSSTAKPASVPTASAVETLKKELGATVVETTPNESSSSEPSTSSTKMCPHGEMTHREGTSARGHWGGWFCPEKKCGPEWD